MSFLEYLSNNKIFFAGATGSELIKMGIKAGEDSSGWNLTHPDEIVALHKSYFDVGVNAVTSSTFTANRFTYPEEGRLETLVEKAMELARISARQSEAEGHTQPKFIGFNIGPSGKLMEPFGELGEEEAADVFRELVSLGTKYGAEFILIETMNEFREARAALKAAKQVTDIPVMLSFTFSGQGRMLGGETVEQAVAMAEDMGADAVGANCSLGPAQLLEIAGQIKAATSLPVIIQPNAGLPVYIKGETCYDIDSDEFAKIMGEIAALGVECLGGCCGTSPEYIDKMIKTVTKA